MIEQPGRASRSGAEYRIVELIFRKYLSNRRHCNQFPFEDRIREDQFARVPGVYAFCWIYTWQKDRVAKDSVAARIAARRKGGCVDPGNGWKYRVVIERLDPRRHHRMDVGHLFRRDVVGPQSIDEDDDGLQR